MFSDNKNMLPKDLNVEYNLSFEELNIDIQLDLEYEINRKILKSIVELSKQQPEQPEFNLSNEDLDKVYDIMFGNYFSKPRDDHI